MAQYVLSESPRYSIAYRNGTSLTYIYYGNNLGLEIQPKKQYATSTPRTYPANNWISAPILPGTPNLIDPYRLSYIYTSGLGYDLMHLYNLDRVYNFLTPPQIDSISVTNGEDEFTINFTDLNNYDGYEQPVYAVHADNILRGYASATDNGGGSKTMVLGAWTKNKTFRIKIAAMRYKNLQYPNIDYSQSAFSNIVNVTSIFLLQNRETNQSLNEKINSSNQEQNIDVIKLPFNTFKRVTAMPLSSYLSTESLAQGSVQYLTGMPISEKFCIAPFDGNLEAKFRIVNGSWDNLFAGGTDYCIKDVSIQPDLPYTNPINMYSQTVKQIYDTQTQEGPYMTNALYEAVRNKIYKYYVECKEYLKSSIKRNTINDYNSTAFSSRSVARDMFDQIAGGDNLMGHYTTKEFPYKGNIYIEAKMLLPSNTGDFFTYAIVDTGNSNVIQDPKRAAGVILFSDPQNPSYSTTVLGQKSSINDLLGG